MKLTGREPDRPAAQPVQEASRSLGDDAHLQPLKLPDTQVQASAPCLLLIFPASAALSSPARDTSLRLIVNVSHVSMG